MQRDLSNNDSAITRSIADSEYGNGVLYRAGDVLFSVRRDSCEGWVYTVYEKDRETYMFDTPAGGYIEGLQGCSASRIASYVSEIISAGSEGIEALDVPMSEFLNHVRQRPIFTYRGVSVFCDPIYRANGKSQTSEIISTIKRLIDDRLALSILLYRSRISGRYSMKLIAAGDDERYSDEPCVLIERADGTQGQLIYDSSVLCDADSIDYDISWAYDLWMEPVFINWHVDGPWIE
ncbi:MAG: hypothetical protein Q4D34_03915 [Eggerthellaceae bacterium]|nr:hypothetical protein [Eggerthellaceae bacterium]